MRVFSLLAAFALAGAIPASAQSLSGQITDAQTSAPLRARVEVVDTSAAVTAGDDGRFTIEVGPAARVTLAVSHPGYYVQRVLLDVATTSTVEVRLAPIVSVNDRIEVTATRAREGADPASFTNIPREKVAEAYWAQDPAMLLAQVVPGVYASNDSGNGIGYSYFSIRGFGQARTRVSLNGAPLNDAESGELFFIDLADFMSTSGDVQVRRGVSGLSGLGGAVDVTTALPAVAPAFNVEFGAGSYGTSRFAVRWDSGLVDGQWALSARYSKVTTDGYRDQSWVDMWNYYLALARYGDRSRLQVVLFGGPEQTHLAYNGVGRDALDGKISGDPERDRRTNPIAWPGEIDNFFQPHYQLVHEFDVSPSTRLSQTLYMFQGDGYYDQYRESRSLVEYNLPDVVLPDGSVISETDLTRRRNVDEWDAGWVPSLRRIGGRWTFGLQGELRIHRAHHLGTVMWAQDYPAGVGPNHAYYDYRTAKNTATAAGEVRVSATSRLAVTGGLQVAYHGYRIDDDQINGVTLSPSYTFVLPRAGAVFTLDPTSNLYVNLARGMREPFLRSIYDPQDYYSTPVALDPEDVWNVEGGVSVQRPRWRVRGNLFWMNFLNEIVYAGALDDNGVPVYGNGAKSRRLGAELDGTWAIAPHFGLDGALSLSRNTFTNYQEYDWSGGSVVYDGNRIAGFPDVMASLTLRGDWRGATAALSVRHAGRFYLDNSQSASSVNDAYTVVDLVGTLPLPASWSKRAGLSRAALTLRVNNLFDGRYTTFGYVDGGDPFFIPAAGRNVFAGCTLGL